MFLDEQGKSTLGGPAKPPQAQAAAQEDDAPGSVETPGAGKVRMLTPKENRERVKAAQDAEDAEFAATANDTGGISGQRLKSFIERVERLEEEKGGIADDIKDIFAESKAVGFDVKTMRKVIRLRKMDKEKRQEEAELLELYKSAIGME